MEQLPGGYTSAPFGGVPAGAGLTLEMKVRFPPNAFQEYYMEALNLYLDGVFVANNYAIEVEFNLNGWTIEVGTTDGSSQYATIPMSAGTGPGSWGWLTDDGDWHHLAWVVDTGASVPSLRMYVDGYLPAGFEVPLTLPAGLSISAADFYGFGYSVPYLKLDIDEVARYTEAIPPTLVAQHAREVAHQPSDAHYTFTDSCGSVLCAPTPITAVTAPAVGTFPVDPRDYAATAEGIAPWQGGTTTTLPADQLKQAPLPRYFPGHTLGGTSGGATTSTPRSLAMALSRSQQLQPSSARTCSNSARRWRRTGTI